MLQKAASVVLASVSGFNRRLRVCVTPSLAAASLAAASLDGLFEHPACYQLWFTGGETFAADGTPSPGIVHKRPFDLLIIFDE